MPFSSKTARPHRMWRGAVAAVAAASALGLGACASSGGGAAGASSSTKPTNTSAAASPRWISYVGGTNGAADSSKAPIKIGWVNNQGGTVVQAGEIPTKAAEAAVKWVNTYAGGIGGHPLELVECFVANTESEGQTCAQKFLADKSIKLVSYGAVAVGAQTIDTTINGTLPIINGISISNSDLTATNTYITFSAGSFIVYGFGTFAAQKLHAKTLAIVYPETPGLLPVAQSVKESASAQGVKVKLVGFDPNSTDLVGALTAAGAATADSIMPVVGVPSQCIAVAKGLKQLNVNPGKVMAFFNCADPGSKAQFPGGDYPKWWYGTAQSGDQYTDTPAGADYKAALTAMGQNNFNDPWASASWSLILTDAKLLNTVGADKLTPDAINAAAKAFKGPAIMGAPQIECGKYSKAPALCADGDYMFQYNGNDSFTRDPTWYQPPPAVQQKYGATG